jgi:phage FluMu protein Com
MESRSRLQHDKNDATPKAETALRCDCGSLLARLVAQGVEIKCRRCKRQVIIPLDANGAVKISV